MGLLATLIRAVAGRGSQIRCVHCGQTAESQRRFVSGPGVYICDVCGPDAMTRFTSGETADVPACSFCGVDGTAVRLGTEGDHAICEECIDLVNHIFAEGAAGNAPASS